MKFRPHPPRGRPVLGTAALGSALGAGTLALLLGLGSAVPVQAADSQASRYYENALDRYEKKDLAGAIIQLKNALQIDKNMLPVQLLLGKALLQNGDVVAAEVAFREALRLGVNRSEVVVPLAQTVVGQGKLKLLFEQQQFALPGLSEAAQFQMQLIRASAYADLGDLRSALRAIDEGRALDPKSPESWLAEVPIRIRSRQFREALGAATRAQTLAPQAAEAAYQKGSVQHVMGDLRGAMDSYVQALKLDPAHVEARVGKAGLHIDFNQPAEAAKDVAELRRLAPGEPRGAYLGALLAERNDDQAAARAALREVTDLIDPIPVDFIRFRPQTLMLNGIAHFGLNQHEKAKPYLELFQKSQANSPVSKLLAQIYLSESNVSRAIDVLESYLRAQPADSQALTLLASAHMAQGRHARATSLMQEALKTRNAPELRTFLGLSLIGSGQIGNAVAELEAAYKRDANQTRAGAALAGLYLRAGQSGKAITIASELVKQQPKNPSFHNLLGMAQAQSGKFPEARKAFEQAIQLDGDLTAAKLNLVRVDIATRAYDAAASRLDGILKSDDKNSEALFEMAMLASLRGQAADALRWLEKANDVAGPREFGPGLALVDFHLRAGRPDPALEIAKRLADKGPDNLQVLMNLGKMQLVHADQAAARLTLTNATRFADFNAPAQVEIARMQVQANNLPGALYSLEKALSGQPDYLPAMALLTEVELRQGDTAKAEKRAREISEKYPRRAVGYGLLGDVAQAKGTRAAAVDFYRRAHQIEPSTATAMALYRALAPQDNGKAALQLAEQWLKAHPNDLVVRKAMADGYARSGNFAQAKSGYEAILKIAPADVDVLNNLANVLLRQKDPGAVKVAEQALAKAPANAVVIDTLGWALFQAGQIDRSLQLLRDARLREPGNPEIRYHLAYVLAQSGRKNEAREELVAALKGERSFESAEEAQKLLQSIR